MRIIGTLRCTIDIKKLKPIPLYHEKNLFVYMIIYE